MKDFYEPPKHPQARPRWPLAIVLVLAMVAFYVFGWQRYFEWEMVRGQLANSQSTS
jgi:hypothetical protein